MPRRGKNWFDRLRDRLFPPTDKDHDSEGKAKGRKRWLFKRTHSLEAASSSSSSLLKEESQRRTDLVVVQTQTHHVDCGTDKGRNGTSTDALHLGTTTTASTATTTTTTTGGLDVSEPMIEIDYSSLGIHIAVIKIQSAFRGYLARKALRALKGLVKLQAIIRGRAVRRRTVATLKCLQSIVHIQSQVCATRYQLSRDKVRCVDSRLTRSYKKKTEMSNGRRWDDILLTAEEESFMSLSKSRTRREKIKADSLNHRHSAELEDRRSVSGKLRNRAGQHSNSAKVVSRSEEIERVDTVGGGKQLRRLNTNNTQQQKPPPQHCIHGLDSPTLTLPRRSLYHHNKTRPLIKTEDFEPVSTNKSPPVTAVPTYMASTESAKAKARPPSLSSSPRTGRIMGYQLSALSDGDSPYKCKISPMSSVNSERTWTGTNLSGKNMDWTAAAHHEYSHQRPRCAHNLQHVMDAAAAARPSCSSTS